MGKLTVESIINIYGSGVKEIKTYNEAKRAKTEEFLQVEPVAFSLSDEPDVLRIYIDKESAAASLDGTLKENTAKQAEEPQDTEGQAEEIAKAIVDGIGKDLAAGLVEYYNLVKQLAEDIPGYKLRDTREIKKLLAEQLPEWDEEDWEDLRAAVEAESQRIWDKQEKTVTMTREQWNKLTCYLLMSTQHREREAKAWAELSEEKAEDGSPKYKNAAGNAEYWREMVTDIEEIRKKIDEA